MEYKITGHEKFSLRYAWLPKAVAAIKKDPNIFSNEDDAMVEMGMGKNMVRSVRFWAVAAGVVAKNGGGYAVTEFGDALFSENGLDPFLEDVKTLWLIHWKLSTAGDPPLLAWDFLLNRWHEPDITKSAVSAALEEEAGKLEKPPAATTLRDHFDVFIRTYAPTRAKKAR